MTKAVRVMLEREVSYDEPDRMPRVITISNLDIIMYVVAIVGHFVDLGFDLNIAIRYFLADRMTEFGWTLVFILLPAFVNTAVSIRMYAQDKEQNSITNEVTKRHWLRIFILVLQMAPILRFIDALIYAIKSRQAERKKDPASQRLYYSLMLKEDSDAALLRIFECFLEAAPQLVLQLSLLIMYDRIFTVHQVLSMTSSLISMGWCLAAYQRAVRFAQQDKANVSWFGSALQTLYHYLLTMSRVAAISVMAILFPYWIIVACVTHILVMSVWIQIFEHPSFCSQRKIAEYAFSLALGAVYLFTYILSVEGRTFCRHTIYYTICCIENFACACLWFLGAMPMIDGFHLLTMLFLIIVPYFLGLVIMIVYYSCFHPNAKKSVRPVAFITAEQLSEIK